MIKFLNNNINEINEVILSTAKKLNLPEIIVEKDLWVSYILMYLFKYSKFKNQFQFKGGTSLSKGYNIINRFSEDVDIILNPNAIDENLDNIATLDSKTKQNKYKNELIEKSISFYKEHLIPEMEQHFNNNIKHKIKVSLDEDEIAIYVDYPSLLNNNYIVNKVKIEISPLAGWEPNETKLLDSYIAMTYPNLFDESKYFVKVTTPDRTFVEKIFILHREAKRINWSNIRYSRHYYDVYKMYKEYYKEDLSTIDEKIYDKVRNFNESYYYQSWAKYHEAKKGSFRLIPNQNYLNSLKKDFTQMKDMIYNEDKLLSFDDIIEVIQKIENELNKIKT